MECEKLGPEVSMRSRFDRIDYCKDFWLAEATNVSYGYDKFIQLKNNFSIIWILATTGHASVGKQTEFSRNKAGNRRSDPANESR